MATLPYIARPEPWPPRLETRLLHNKNILWNKTFGKVVDEYMFLKEFMKHCQSTERWAQQWNEERRDGRTPECKCCSPFSMHMYIQKSVPHNKFSDSVKP